MHNYQEKWRLKLQEALGPEGWGDVIHQTELEGLFSDWKRTWDPGGSAEFYLRSALEILCGDQRHPHAQTFLYYASQVAERAYHETERWLPSGDWGNPERWIAGTRSTLLRAKAITDAIVSNAEPDTKLLTEAAQVILGTTPAKRAARVCGPSWSSRGA